MQPQVVTIKQGLKCTDSDGGKNEYVKGVVMMNTQVMFTDRCVDPYQIEEAYCDSVGSARPYYKKYFQMCDNGCSDGACKN